MTTITKTAASVEEATKLALEELGTTEDKVEVEVISEPQGGFLGMGKKDAEVKVTLKEDDAPISTEDESDDDVYYGDDENFEGDMASEAEDAAVNFVAEVLSGIGIHGNMDSYREDDTIHISVTGSDCASAIGRHGETLDAISYMTNLVANKHSDERVHVHLDIGGYKKHREQVLKNLAGKAASRALRTGRKVDMEPMNPAQRRLVHAYLQDFEGVTTHSEGTEPNRHVVVTPEG